MIEGSVTTLGLPELSILTDPYGAHPDTTSDHMERRGRGWMIDFVARRDRQSEKSLIVRALCNC